ncbi:MAG: hypothetical protein ABIY52_12475 [Gemmatimonadaceae bacterium]
MTTLRDVLAVIGALAVLAFVVAATWCATALRRASRAHQYADEMQEGGR